ncbi:MAG: tetrahydromethanopterin S-methyltransferase subunit F [Methanomicrobiaceae archaeon]|nr:tetrahydromethanopterin S-methyltransferase subunit F [Methanomicrobiaceae archaeon]
MVDETTQTAGPIRMAAIDRMVESIRYKAQIMARTNKLESGVISMGLVGFGIGLGLTLVLVLIPAMLLGGL